MNWQDQAKLTHAEFSSCRGVSFEPKTSLGSPFALDVTACPPQPPPDDAPGGAGQWVWLPAAFSRGSAASRIFPAEPESHAFARSQSRASSHFCDLEDEDTSDDEFNVNGVDEEMAVAVVPAAADDVTFRAKSRGRRCRPGARGSASYCWTKACTVYKRLFVLCIVMNATGPALAATWRFPYAKGHAALFAMGNILALTLCRSEAVLRIVFWLAVKLFGHSWVPLLIRNSVTATLQSLGGVHSGCGVSSLAWLVYALVQVLQQRHVTPREIVGVASAILGQLTLSCMAAFLLVRHLHHNVFERTHRFAGWTALALLWAFVVLSAGYDRATKSYNNLTSAVLVKRQELWLAAAITFFTFLPWLTVRRVPVTVTARSTHASVITFQGGVKAGLLGRISRSPLSEWHAFGIISDGGDTHAMLAGAVGDFTRGLISDPPSRLWPGAAELSFVWVAKGIEANYGEEMKATVLSSDRLRGRVIVHDAAVMGRPDVAELAVGAAKRWGAEVVVVTSNPEGSRDVVTGCSKAGIPAFGPIWDS